MQTGLQLATINLQCELYLRNNKISAANNISYKTQKQLILQMGMVKLTVLASTYNSTNWL